jgi:hypothetical protein
MLQNSVETSSRADGKAPLCLAEFVTPKGRGGLTDVCADGKPIFCCNNREMTELGYNSEQPIEIRLVLSGTASDLRAFRQPITFVIRGFDSGVGFGGKSVERWLFGV